jgi:hypothetical protein
MMKRCRNMKQRQRQARRGSMKRKRGTAWRHRPEGRRHQRGEMGETTLVGLTQILLGQKIKKIYAVDSAVTNGRRRFKVIIY